jgi:hypothetical protein
MTENIYTGDRRAAYNSTYPKVAGKCNFERLCIYQTFIGKDSLVFQIATFG